ncbi:MAG: zf-HC2 domain-containing protein [Planctomycetia bacterium]|nr:MAG: zf-HC2 domain-containing protein [Planctomycetia bacterium]
MTCREVAEFLSDYVEGRMEPALRARFERHLAECPPCVTYLGTFQAAIKLAKAACRSEGPPSTAASEHPPEELVSAILSSCEKQHRADNSR